MKLRFLLMLLGVAWALPAAAQQPFDAIQLLDDVRVLAADSLEGRRAGSAGGARARAYVKAAFERVGVQPFGEGYEQPFTLSQGLKGQRLGVNLVGVVPGTGGSDRYVVLTAHYDHLGIRDGVIYNGADDNASGVAGLFAIADYFRRHPPRHNLIVAALDAEEEGLRGARAFINKPPVPLERIALNVNLDMISRSDADELFVVGTHHHPALRGALERVGARSRLHVRLGHDGKGADGDDWTQASDHGAFHRVGIPFLYFGVEDHADYHRPGDDYGNIDPAFLIRAVETIIVAIEVLDARLEDLLPASSH